LIALLLGCSDPPDPAVVTSPTGSTAGWVEWRAPDTPVRGPVVRVVDVPGGPYDRLVADPDVTTFLNDRFHPIFVRAGPTSPDDPGITFLDGCGCVLLGPIRPERPSEMLSLANWVIAQPDALACQGQVYMGHCPETNGAD
jgi:hypothetical protein